MFYAKNGFHKIQKIVKLSLPTVGRLFEIDNFLNFEVYVMFRQAQHDIHFKILKRRFLYQILQN